jgi:FAD/FMN-containing dehydrogenase
MSELTVVKLDGSKGKLNQKSVEEFSSNLKGDLILAGDAGYDDARLLWNKMHNKKPGLIARCEGVADVIAAVNFARENDLLTSIRGGGHNVGGTASCDGGLMINLSKMNSVRVDSKTKTVRVGGGATHLDMDRETQVFGMAAAAGVVSTTGIAGLTLGGGLGHLRRKHGLAIDNLLSVDIVTADGKFHTASATENSDLFWGVRGGGGNFGVVTSFEFKVHNVGPDVAFIAVWYPIDNAKELLLKWQDYMNNAPEELSCNAMFWSVPAIPDIPKELHNKRALIFGGVHCGDLEEGLKVIQPLRELGKPLLDMSGPTPWSGVQTGFDGFFPTGGRYYYFKSSYMQKMDEDSIDVFLDQVINPPVPPVLVALWHYGGKMQRVGDSDTAFMGRSAPYLFSVDGVWDDVNDTDKVVTYARSLLEDIKPISGGGLYVNFAGLGEEGNDLVRSAYGENYDRLVSLKNKYDPTNLFRLNQNIKPTV